MMAAVKKYFLKIRWRALDICQQLKLQMEEAACSRFTSENYWGIYRKVLPGILRICELWFLQLLYLIDNCLF